MGSPFKDHQSHSPSYTHSFIKKILPYFIYVILPIAVIRLYLYSPTLPQSPTLHNHLPQPSTVHHLPHSTTPISITTTTPSSSSSSKHGKAFFFVLVNYSIGVVLVFGNFSYFLYIVNKLLPLHVVVVLCRTRTEKTRS